MPHDYSEIGFSDAHSHASTIRGFAHALLMMTAHDNDGDAFAVNTIAGAILAEVDAIEAIVEGIQRERRDGTT